MQHGREHSKTYVTKEWSDKERRMVDCEAHFHPSSPWATDPESMCLKTVLIHVCKLLPLSVEVQRIIQADETSRDYRHGMTNMLDAPSNTDWNEYPAAPKQLPEPADPAKPRDPNDPGDPPEPKPGATKEPEIPFGN